MDNAIYVNVPVGPSGCGKSSLAAERMYLYPDMMIVSEDKIREMFYGKYAYKHNFEEIVHEAARETMWVVLRNGSSLFVDEINTTMKAREEILTLVRRFCTLCHPSRPIKVVAWYFKIGEGFVDYLIGKRMEENKGLDPIRWKKIIMDQVACLVPPTREEGFDEVYIIDRDNMTDESYAKKCYNQQCSYAEKIKAHVFVPRSGTCPKCNGTIWTVENVVRSYDELITGCPHCNWSFCE